MSDVNTEMLERVDSYYEAMVLRYRFYLESVFFPKVDGKRQTLFTESLTEQEEYLRLQEAAQKAVMVAQGQMEPDNEVTMFMENRDGAHERYEQLKAKFGGRDG